MVDIHSWQLQLLGFWRLDGRDGAVTVTSRQQRLIALLALQGDLPRAALAGILWPGSSERRASGSLRETLWTINHQLPGLLEENGRTVALAAGVAVDVHEIQRQTAQPGPERPATHRVRLLGLLRDAILLPGWYEEWALTEQDSLTRLRIGLLEDLAEELLKAEETALATDAAQGAVDLDPWREHALGLLLRAHRANGEHTRVLQLYEEFSARLRGEFGVDPSQALTRLARRSRDDGRLGTDTRRPAGR